MPITSAPSRPERPPSPGSQPPITTSVEPTFLTLTQPEVRRPGVYGQSSRLAITPSSRWARVASSSAAPSPTWWAGACQVGPGELELGQRGAALVVAQLQQRAAVEVEQVERDVVDRVLCASRRDRVLGGQVHAALELLEARPRAVERDHLAVEDHLAPGERRGRAGAAPGSGR